MKHHLSPVLAGFLLCSAPLHADLVIPSDGSDGVFSPTANVEVDLSLAQSGAWNTPVSGPNVGKGTYDPDKWAVVFKYASVNIPAGVTVTFKNHATRAPVVWLVQGSVNIAGTVSVNGRNWVTGTAALTPTEPGPGGFRGGAYGPSGNGAGLGIGNDGNSAGYNGRYGNPQILPLIGGSGSSANGTSGGSGGGALLIAAPNGIQINGTISSLRGFGNDRVASGGAVKLIADQVTGTGNVTADTDGRVRIEANSLNPAINTTPPTIAVPPGTAPVIFQSAIAPTVRIVSVDGIAAPADPTAPLVSGADVAIQKSTPVIIVLETRNFATSGGVVAVRIAYKYGGMGWINATLDSGGTSLLSTWRLSTILSPGFVTLQARATAP